MKRHLVIISLFCLLLGGCVKKVEEQPMETLPPEETVSPLLEAADSAETTTLELNGENTMEEFLSVLPSLPKLREVSWKPCPLSMEERKELRTRCPELRFDWELQLGNTVFSSLSEEVDGSAEPKNIAALAELLPLMEAKTVDLSTWDMDPADAAALREVGDGVAFLYPVELYGQSFFSTDTEIDFGEWELNDTAELESSLVLFNDLQKVVMLGTTLDNDTMEALNQRHEGTQFVWLVQVMTLAIRSDATFFTIYNPYELRYTREPVTNLRYCHDMIAVDLGHCGIGQDDLEFVRGCPKLQFLILAECYVHNLEPLRACPELRYLEAFKTYLDDISALVDCPKLTDLNICYIPSLGVECMDTLLQMTQLEHLWFCDANMPANKILELRDALPNTEFIYWKGPESTGAGWRDHDIYYEMRDAMERPYMN